MAELTAPVQYFGGKRRIADEIWSRFRDVDHYIEPFCGSAAVLLGRPGGAPDSGAETINDINGYVTNFWRAVKFEPDALSVYAAWPINELDLHSRRDWLQSIRDDLTERLRSDPEFYDIRSAAWWCWGASVWLGRGWPAASWQQIPDISSKNGGGVAGMDHRECKFEFRRLADRLEDVRVLCGGWKRPLQSDAALRCGGNAEPVGVFLDPPYRGAETVYADDSDDVAGDVEQWCREHGDDRTLRIALCGTAGDYSLPGWDVYEWTAPGGYKNVGGDDSGRDTERVWFSPGCAEARQTTIEDQIHG